MRKRTDFIAGRFRRNSRVTVVAAALGNSDRQLTLHLLGDSSSAYRTAGSALAAPMKDVARVFDEWKIEDLACAKINVRFSLMQATALEAS